MRELALLFSIPIIIFTVCLLKESMEMKRVIQSELNAMREEMELEKAKKNSIKLEKEKGKSDRFQHSECKDLNDLFVAREEYIYEMLNHKFDKTEMSFMRYDQGIKTCKKYFYQNLDIADNDIVRVASPETYSDSLIKSKELLKGIDKMMIELIKYENSKTECDSALKDLNSLIKDIKRYY